MSAIISFQFDAQAVRVQIDELGQPWFNANDVCSALEFTNPHKAVANHFDADDLTKREVIDTLGRQQYAMRRGNAVLVQQTQRLPDFLESRRSRAVEGGGVTNCHRSLITLFSLASEWSGCARSAEAWYGGAGLGLASTRFGPAWCG